MKKKVTKKKTAKKKSVKKTAKKTVIKASKKAAAKKQVEGRKKRGRPKGSKNKNSEVKEASPKIAKKRGRPKGSTNKANKDNNSVAYHGSGNSLSRNLPDDYVEPKSYKFLGYCSGRGCNCMIMSNDMVSKVMFSCPICGKRDRMTKLKKETGPKREISKKEFLEGTLNADYHDMPAMEDPIIDVKPEL